MNYKQQISDDKCPIIINVTNPIKPISKILELKQKTKCENQWKLGPINKPNKPNMFLTSRAYIGIADASPLQSPNSKSLYFNFNLGQAIQNHSKIKFKFKTYIIQFSSRVSWLNRRRRSKILLQWWEFLNFFKTLIFSFVGLCWFLNLYNWLMIREVKEKI